MRTEREKRIAGNYQTRKTLCKRNGTPFSITQEEWFAAWRSHPDWEDSGYIVKRDPAGEWTASNIHYEPQRAKAPNCPNHKGSRTLTVRQWIAELGGNAHRVLGKPIERSSLRESVPAPPAKSKREPHSVVRAMDPATKEKFLRLRDRVRNEYTYANRVAERADEAFPITAPEWMSVWRASPHFMEDGHMVRLYPNEPWSTTNCEYVQGLADGRVRRRWKRNPLSTLGIA